MTTRREVMRIAQHAEIIKLRHDGYSLDEISAKVGVSPLKAQVLLEEALTQLQGDSTKHLSAIREIELLRLETATKALMPGVEKGETSHIHTLLKVQDRRARLLGLDGAIKTDATVTLDIPWLQSGRLSYRNPPPTIENSVPAIEDVEPKTPAPWKEPAQDPEIGAGVSVLKHQLLNPKGN